MGVFLLISELRDAWGRLRSLFQPCAAHAQSPIVGPFPLAPVTDALAGTLAQSVMRSTPLLPPGLLLLLLLLASSSSSSSSWFPRVGLRGRRGRPRQRRPPPGAWGVGRRRSCCSGGAADGERRRVGEARRFVVTLLCINSCSYDAWPYRTSGAHPHAYH